MSEDRDQMSEDRGQMSEDRGQIFLNSEGGSRNYSISDCRFKASLSTFQTAR